jgi:hypothetical protein
MKYRYVPTHYEVYQAMNFAESFAEDHMRNGRDEKTLISNIAVGKLGEIAYKNYYGDAVSEVDWSGIPQGKEPDFINKKFSTKIQIKTLNEDTKWCSFGSWNFDILVVFRMVKGEVHYINTYTNPILREKAKSSKFNNGWYFYPSDDVNQEYPAPPEGYNYYP